MDRYDRTVTDNRPMRPLPLSGLVVLADMAAQLAALSFIHSAAQAGWLPQAHDLRVTDLR